MMIAKVYIMDANDAPPFVAGESGYDVQGRRSYVDLDPEKFDIGEVKEARNPSNVVRDAHSYRVECIEKDEPRDGWVVGVFEIKGFHTTDDMNPEDYETEEIRVVVKVKDEEIEEKRREAIRRHLIGLLKAIP